jgi:uncharacterized protein (TIGR02996 family)
MMSYDAGFLKAIHRAPGDDLPRLIYADWLDERGDPRGSFIRLHLALTATAPDHADRVDAERDLSVLRTGCDPEWLSVIEPERVPRSDDLSLGRGCSCFEAGYENSRWPKLYLHNDAQDTECDGWKRVLEVVEEAAADGREEFHPLRQMSQSERSQIVTLPASIAKLKAVKKFGLYGSCLVRIPPEIAGMESLSEFVPYTSYRLHWFPYEITLCRNLKTSTVSTRALYGNFKYRPPFPSLEPGTATASGRPEPERLVSRPGEVSTRPCSVCGKLFEDRRLHRKWISLRVATDVLPLLVNACSNDCISRLPQSPEKYVQGPHSGGPEVTQPSTGY